MPTISAAALDGQPPDGNLTAAQAQRNGDRGCERIDPHVAFEREHGFFGLADTPRTRGAMGDMRVDRACSRHRAAPIA